MIYISVHTESKYLEVSKNNYIFNIYVHFESFSKNNFDTSQKDFCKLPFWTPKATLLRHLSQNIPTCWYILALPNAKICVSPDGKPKIAVIPDDNPRRQSVEYRWNIGGEFFALGLYISCCLCQFHLRRAPNANSFFSGIWAFKQLKQFFIFFPKYSIYVRPHIYICPPSFTFIRTYI